MSEAVTRAGDDRLRTGLSLEHGLRDDNDDDDDHALGVRRGVTRAPMTDDTSLSVSLRLRVAGSASEHGARYGAYVCKSLSFLSGISGLL